MDWFESQWSFKPSRSTLSSTETDLARDSIESLPEVEAGLLKLYFCFCLARLSAWNIVNKLAAYRRKIANFQFYVSKSFYTSPLNMQNIRCSSIYEYFLFLRSVLGEYVHGQTRRIYQTSHNSLTTKILHLLNYLIRLNPRHILPRSFTDQRHLINWQMYYASTIL